MAKSAKNNKTEGGLLFQGYRKSSDASSPLISIITVVYNNVESIEETILSVINQTYSNVEYIVIDGGSTDGTVDVIKQYNAQIDYWISEPDAGIYDAMNKGLIYATGKWVNFMNSGDMFFQNDVLMQLLKYFASDNDVIYGDVEYRYKGVRFVRRARNVKYMWTGMIASHQSFFVKRRLHQNNPFILDYKLSADYHFLYSLYFRGMRFQYVSTIVSSNEYSNSLSNLLAEVSVIERRDILRSIRGDNLYDVYYFLLYYNILLRKALKKILPEYLVKRIMMRKN